VTAENPEKRAWSLDVAVWDVVRLIALFSFMAWPDGTL
jgi:hypothetical protein